MVVEGRENNINMKIELFFVVVKQHVKKKFSLSIMS